MHDLVIEKINLHGPERIEIERFLSNFGLILEKDVEHTIAAKLQNEMVGTCSCTGNILKCFAVKAGLQGEGIASQLITCMTNFLFDQGIYGTFIYTTPKNSYIFKGLGYREIYGAEEVVLLEGGSNNIDKALEDMRCKINLGSGKKAALVMNCNPFTLGHQYLIERAAKENEKVVVFVVEEDRSLFPLNVRLELVRKGTEQFENVYVLPGGRYIISSATFPTYFLREDSDKSALAGAMDAGIFGKYIAPTFHIHRRYIGTEPYCSVTNKYNQALMKILPEFKIEVKLVRRLEIEGTAVSASEVRRSIKKEDWYNIKKLVPSTTYEFLRSSEAKKLIEKIKDSEAPH